MNSIKVLIYSATGAVNYEGELFPSSGSIRHKEMVQEKLRSVWTTVDHLCKRGQKVVEIEEIKEKEPVFSSREEELIKRIVELRDKAKRLTKSEKKELAELETELESLGEAKSSDHVE